jgi:hypothetical protein
MNRRKPPIISPRRKTINDNKEYTKDNTFKKSSILKFFKEGIPQSTDDITKGYIQGCKWLDISTPLCQEYVCASDKENEAVWLLSDKVKEDLGTAAYKNFGKDDNDLPLNKHVKEVIEEVLKKEPKQQLPLLTQDHIVDGKDYKRFSKEEKDRLASVKPFADVTNKDNVKSSGAVMRSDDSVKGCSWVSDDIKALVSTKDKIPTQRLVEEVLDNKIKELDTNIKRYINKNIIPHSIVRVDDKGIESPLPVPENSIIGRTKDNKISALLPVEIRKMINVEDGSNKVTKELLKKFKTIMSDDEDIKDNKWVVNEENKEVNNDNKLPTLKLVNTKIDNSLNDKTSDNLKEGNIHKYFNNKTQDDLPDGKTHIRYTQSEREKLRSIENKADITNKDNVKKSGAVMLNDPSIKTAKWVINESDMKSNSEDKVPTQKSVKEYIYHISTDDIKEGKTNKYFNDNISSDNIKEGRVNKYFNNKTTDDLQEGNTNKFLTEDKINTLITRILAYVEQDALINQKVINYIKSINSDLLSEGKTNRYFTNNRTSDDLKEGNVNKYFKGLSHNELKNIEGGNIHLNELSFNDLCNGGISLLHTHRNIPHINLQEDAKFNSLKATLMCCDNGEKIPYSAKIGQWFLHTPVGRKILYQYDGNVWQPIFNYGDIHLYVDMLAGIDEINKGTNKFAESFKSVQYALKQIPKFLSDQVFIYLSSSHMAESIELTGIVGSQNATIHFIGSLNTLHKALSDSAIVGSGASHGSLTDLDSFSLYQNKLIYSLANKESHIIDSVTADTSKIAGIWSELPTGEYTVYDWGTILSRKLDIINTSITITFTNINFTSETGINILQNDNYIIFNNCLLNSNTYISTSKVKFIKCLTFGSIDVNNYSSCLFDNCKLTLDLSLNDNKNDFILNANYFSNVRIMNGCIVDGNNFENVTGIACSTNSIIDMLSFVDTGYHFIRNCFMGITCKRNGMIINSDNVQFIKNTIKRNIMYVSNGYID